MLLSWSCEAAWCEGLQHAWSLYKFEGWDLIPGGALQEISTQKDDATILLKGGSLEEDSRYRISVNSSRNGDVEFIVSYLAFWTNSSPRRGHCLASPTEGFAVFTPFFFSCMGWIDEDLPLSYSFKYKVSSAAVIFYQGKNPYANATMPLGDPSKNYSLQVEMVVMDKLGAMNSVSFTLKVTALTAADNDPNTKVYLRDSIPLTEFLGTTANLLNIE